MKISTIAIWTFAIILVLSLPFILDFEHFRMSTDIDSERFSHFGEYIGGFLGAAFTGMSFFILALTFRHQIQSTSSAEVNESMRFINSLYESVAVEINNIKYKNWTGSQVFFEFSINSLDEDQNVLDQMNSALLSMRYLVDAGKVGIYPSSDVKDHTMSRIYFLCYSKIIWPLNSRILSGPIKDRLQRFHDDFPNYFERYQQLTNETFEYLETRNLIAPKNNSTSTTKQTTIRPQ